MGVRTSQTKAIVSAQDKASPELKKIKQNFRKFSKDVHNLGSKLKDFGAITSLPIAGAFASAAAIVKNSVTAMSDYGTAVDNTSRSLGVASDSLQAFRYAAQLGGSSAEQMDGALMMLNKNIANASAGKNKDLVALMNHLGISMKDANGKMKTAAELMPEVADAISRQTDSTQKAYIATQFFGRSGQNLVKTLNDGAAGLEKARKEAEDFGVIMSEEDVAAATAFGDSMTRTRYAVQGVQNAIGSKLLPVLQPLLDDFNDWIKLNREWIANTITDAVKDFSKALKDIDIKKVVAGFMEFVKTSAQVFSALGGLKTVGIAVGAIFAGKVLVSLISVGSAIASLIPTIISLSAALWANPIVLIVGGIIAAIGALSFAVYEIYKHWDTVSGWFSNLWQGIKSIFSSYAGMIKKEWDFICSLPDLVKRAFSGLVSWFGGIWEGIKSAFFGPFEDAYNKISGAMSTISSATGKAWDSVTGFLGFGNNEDQTSAPALTPRQQMALSSPITAGVSTQIISSSNKSEVVVKLHTDEKTHAEVESSKSTASSLQTSVDLGATR